MKDEQICGKDLKITYEYGQPKGIRDWRGSLFFFRQVSKYDGQEERYRNELNQMNQLANFVLSALKKEIGEAE